MAKKAATFPSSVLVTEAAAADREEERSAEMATATHGLGWRPSKVAVQE